MLLQDEGALPAREHSVPRHMALCDLQETQPGGEEICRWGGPMEGEAGAEKAHGAGHDAERGTKGFTDLVAAVLGPLSRESGPLTAMRPASG